MLIPLLDTAPDARAPAALAEAAAPSMAALEAVAVQRACRICQRAHGSPRPTGGGGGVATAVSGGGNEGGGGGSGGGSAEGELEQRAEGRTQSSLVGMLSLGEREKAARKLTKKLREVEALREAAAAPGAPPLDEMQLSKLATEEGLRAQLAELMGSGEA